MSPRAPPCQPSGEFQGRTEALSGSVDAQPEMTVASAARTSNNKRCVARIFTLGRSGMGRGYNVAFDDFTEFPTGHDVGDAAVFLDIADDNFRG